MHTIIEFNNVYDLVEKLLASEERCRNDDKWLCYRVLRHFTSVYIPFNDFSKFPSFETISRCRRKIQNDERRFVANTDTINKRKERERDVREWITQ